MTLRQFDRLDHTERGYWIAEWLHEQNTCRDCGSPLSECSDGDKARYPQRRICYATMAREASMAMYAELHEKRPFHDGTFTRWAEKRSSRHPYHFGDGVTIYVADKDAAPWDEFTTLEKASPVKSEPELDKDRRGNQGQHEHGDGVGLIPRPDGSGDDDAADR